MIATAHKAWIGVLLSPPEVGRFDREHVIGVHVTEIFSAPSGDATELEALSQEEKTHWQSFLWWIENKGAYNSLQSTVPQTLAHALADSPVGQLAWNYQIYGDAVSYDYILTNVMVYWLTNTAASSARFYYENAHAQHVPTRPTTIPLGLANFADVHQAIRIFAERDHKKSWKSASKIGSTISSTAHCTTRSRMVGIPSGRSLPFALGI